MAWPLVWFSGSISYSKPSHRIFFEDSAGLGHLLIGALKWESPEASPLFLFPPYVPSNFKIYTHHVRSDCRLAWLSWKNHPLERIGYRMWWCGYAEPRDPGWSCTQRTWRQAQLGSPSGPLKKKMFRNAWQNSHGVRSSIPVFLFLNQQAIENSAIVWWHP